MAAGYARPGIRYEAGDSRIAASIAVGAYSRFEVHPPCGLAGVHNLIGALDQPGCFYELGRLGAGLLWFRSGYVEYRLATRLPPGATVTRLACRAEMCSDAPGYDPNWPSDITLWINGVEVVTILAKGDFGGSRGRLTPPYWQVDDTQFGELRQVVVDAAGCLVDGIAASPVTVADLCLGAELVLRLGVKRDAEHVGGISLFGATFGNEPQDVILELDYAAPPAPGMARSP